MVKLKGIFLLILLAQCINSLAGNDAEVIEWLSNYSIRNDKLTREEKVTIQINNRLGEKYGSIKIPFSKSNGIKNFDISLTDKFGNEIRKIKKSEIVDVSAFASYSFYEDEYYKTVDLKHNQYPYRISYSYQTEFNEFLQIANWYPILDAEIPTHNAILTFTAPQGYGFRSKQSHMVDVAKKVIDDQIVYQWTAQYDHPITTEINSPPIQELLPNAQIVPEKFVYGIPGSFESWSSFGDWVYDLNRDLDELPDYEKQKIDALVKGNPDDISKIKKIYDYLQKNTRYVNIKLGIGGLQSYPAEYVARNKYGDCKALTNYLKSALNYIGIKSYYALINAGQNPEKIDVDFPSQQFNHVILYIPMNGRDVWLECTDNTAPFNYLGLFTQNRKAFVIDQKNSRFMTTPAISETNSFDTNKSDLTILKDNTLSIKSDYVFKRTDYFELYNYFHHSGSQKKLDEFIDHLSIYPNCHTLEKRMKKKAEAPDEIKIELMSKTNSPLRKYGEEVLLDFPTLQLPAFELPDHRKLPLRIDHPIHKIDTFLIHFEDEPTLLRQPEAVRLQSDFGAYSFYEIPCLNSNNYQYTREFYLYPGDYDVSEYRSFYNFLADIKKAENRKIIFSH